jgi:acid phosphatase (class A)
MIRIALVLALVCAASPAIADAPALLTAAQVDVRGLLPPPPAPGSPQERAEIAELRHIAKTRSPAALAAAIRDANDESGAFFAEVIGAGFDLASLPATAKMLNDVHATEEAAAKPAKMFFARDRPWIAISKLQTCTPHKPGPAKNSYPSGHATVAYAMGVILAALLPAKAQAILERSAEFSENRLVCGVHFRSDIVAGQVFGTVLAQDLLQNSQFQLEYAAAAAELSAAHLR